MSVNIIIFVACAQALLFDTATSQCFTKDIHDSGITFIANCGESAVDIITSSDDNLHIINTCTFPPTEFVVASENSYEGALAATEELPFVETVAVQSLPTASTGAVSYGCRNGNSDTFAKTVLGTTVSSPAGITTTIPRGFPSSIYSSFRRTAFPIAYKSGYIAPARFFCGQRY